MRYIVSIVSTPNTTTQLTDGRGVRTAIRIVSYRYKERSFYRASLCVARYLLYRYLLILSVRPSVRLSVTLVDCVHTVRPTIMISSPYGSPIILVSGDIMFIPKFEGGHPERGR